MKDNVKPLLGHFSSLDDLFEGFTLSHAVKQPEGGIAYPKPPGWFYLGGLPGSINGDKALIAKPKPFVLEAVSERCVNGVVGSFRSVRSAYWMKQDLLPVFAYDSHHIANPFVALVPYSEHERFAKGVRP